MVSGGLAIFAFHSPSKPVRPSFEGQYPLNGWTHASPLEDRVRSEWDGKLRELVCYSSNQINDIVKGEVKRDCITRPLFEVKK